MQAILQIPYFDPYMTGLPAGRPFEFDFYWKMMAACEGSD